MWEAEANKYRDYIFKCSLRLDRSGDDHELNKAKSSKLPTVPMDPVLDVVYTKCLFLKGNQIVNRSNVAKACNEDPGCAGIWISYEKGFPLGVGYKCQKLDVEKVGRDEVTSPKLSPEEMDALHAAVKAGTHPQRKTTTTTTSAAVLTAKPKPKSTPKMEADLKITRDVVAVAKAPPASTMAKTIIKFGSIVGLIPVAWLIWRMWRNSNRFSVDDFSFAPGTTVYVEEAFADVDLGQLGIIVKVNMDEYIDVNFACGPRPVPLAKWACLKVVDTWAFGDGVVLAGQIFGMDLGRRGVVRGVDMSTATLLIDFGGSENGKQVGIAQWPGLEQAKNFEIGDHLHVVRAFAGIRGESRGIVTDVDMNSGSILVHIGDRAGTIAVGGHPVKSAQVLLEHWGCLQAWPAWPEGARVVATAAFDQIQAAQRGIVLEACEWLDTETGAGMDVTFYNPGSTTHVELTSWRNLEAAPTWTDGTRLEVVSNFGMVCRGDEGVVVQASAWDGPDEARIMVKFNSGATEIFTYESWSCLKAVYMGKVASIGIAKTASHASSGRSARESEEDVNKKGSNQSKSKDHHRKSKEAGTKPKTTEAKSLFLPDTA